MSAAGTDAAALRNRIAQIFLQTPFVCDLGIEMRDAGIGWCEAVLPLAPRHFQHTGVVHAGAITTLADHCAGAAAWSQCRDGEQVLTVEFKVNLLRAGRGERLVCRAQVLKPGRSFHVVESEVWGEQADGTRTLVAKFNGTMAVVPA